MSSSDPRLTLLALDVMSQGCLDLCDYESKTVAETWHCSTSFFLKKKKIAKHLVVGRLII